MELKDVILSTLAEMEEDTAPQAPANSTDFEVKETRVIETPEQIQESVEDSNISANAKEQTIESEVLYLSSIRERLLVLFEGFQAPNNSNIEAKIDMTLNFLEYTLATIDARLEKLQKGSSL